MQINLFDNLPNSSSDSTTTRSRDRNGHNTASPFFIQMDHAYNQANGKNDGAAKEKPVEQVSSPSGKEKLSSLSVEPTDDPLSPDTDEPQVSDLNLSGPKVTDKENLEDAGSPTEKTGRTSTNPSPLLEPSTDSANPLKQTRSESKDSGASQVQSIKEPQKSIRAKVGIQVDAETADATVSTSEKGAVTFWGSQDIDDASDKTQPAVPAADLAISRDRSGWELRLDGTDGAAFKKSEFDIGRDSTPFPGIRQVARSENLDLQDDFRTPPDSATGSENVDKALAAKAQVIMSAAPKYANVAGMPFNQVTSGKTSVQLKAQEEVPENTQIAMDTSQTILHRTRWGLPAQPEGDPIVKDPSLAEDSIKTRDEDGSDADPKGVGAPKTESKASMLFENASSGDRAADQNPRPDSTIAWAALQGKGEGSQPISGKSQISFVNRQADIAAPLAAGSMRMTDSSMSQPSGTGQNSPAQSRNFIFQLAEQIQVQLRNGKGEIRIQLKPESLGRLEIRAESANGGVVARIATESSQVKGYLENNLSFLQQALQGQGLRIDRIHIVIQNGFDFQSASGFTTQFGHAGSGHHGDGSHSSARVVGLSSSNQSEEITVDPAAWIALNPNVSFHTVA
jgi:flagellar hook-length control protein FliK